MDMKDEIPIQTKVIDGYTLILNEANSTITIILDSEEVGHFEETAQYMYLVNAQSDFDSITDRHGVSRLLDRMY